MTGQSNAPEEHDPVEFHYRIADEMQRLAKEHEEDMAWSTYWETNDVR